MKSLYFFLLSLLATSSHATHMLGGYITYKHIANQLYEIKLVVYRDCNSATPFDGAPGAITNAVLGIFEQGGGLHSTIELTNPQISTVTIFDTACPSQPSFCMEQGIYSTTFNLPHPSKAYNIVHERCCFGGYAVNVFDPGNTGIAFTATIPSLTSATNSTPVFDSIPSGYVVANDNMGFSYQATDADGDSLVYSFAALNVGGDVLSPAPNPPNGPPYNQVAWASGYSVNNPLGTSLLTIDSATGWVGGVTTQIGYYVTGIQIQEYRNNQLINTNTRMVTFMVDGCFPNSVEEMSSSLFHAFPNPFADLLTIELTDVTDASLQLLHVNGKVLQEMKLTGKTTAISTTHLPAGYYLVKVISGNGASATHRFLKLVD